MILMNYFNAKENMMLDISASNSKSKLEELLGRPLNRTEMRLRKKDESNGCPPNQYIPEKEKVLLVAGEGTLKFSEKEEKFVRFLMSQSESYVFVSNESDIALLEADIIANKISRVYLLSSCQKNVCEFLRGGEVKSIVHPIPDISFEITSDILLEGDMFVPKNIFETTT